MQYKLYICHVFFRVTLTEVMCQLATEINPLIRLVDQDVRVLMPRQRLKTISQCRFCLSTLTALM